MIRFDTCAVAALALPILIAATAADAQRPQRKDQLSPEARAARMECNRNAQARFPGPRGNISVRNSRQAVYRDCLHGKGLRP